MESATQLQTFTYKTRQDHVSLNDILNVNDPTVWYSGKAVWPDSFANIFTRIPLRAYLDQICAPTSPMYFNRVGQREWMHAYAKCVGTTDSFDHIRRLTHAQLVTDPHRHNIVSKATTHKYVRQFTESGIVRSIPGHWAKRPMHSFVNASFVSYIGQFTPEKLLTTHAQELPRLWRHHVGHKLIEIAEELGATVTHGHRASSRHTVDFLVTNQNGESVAVLASLSPWPNSEDVRNAAWVRRRAVLRDDLDLVNVLVVNPGDRAQWHHEGFVSCALGLLTK